MRDIVLPQDNEEEFLKIAEELGYDKITFCYDVGKDAETRIKDIEAKAAILREKTKISIDLAIIATKKDILNLKKYKKTIIIRSNREDDRWMIEKARPDLIYGFEFEKAKDGIHQRNSGLNQVLCKLMKENKIIYSVPYSEIFMLNDRVSSQIIGRVIQNIRLLRKYKSQIKIASFANNPYQMRNPNDLISFFSTKGMHAKEAKDAMLL